jgi:predicted Zn-dependent peptidase
MNANLERVLNEMRALSPAELEQVRKIVDELLASQTQDAERELAQRLLAAGLLSEIKPPSRDVESFRRYQPVKVEGKPVSETIIEERR